MNNCLFKNFYKLFDMFLMANCFSGRFSVLLSENEGKNEGEFGIDGVVLYLCEIFGVRVGK